MYSAVQSLPFNQVFNMHVKTDQTDYIKTGYVQWCMPCLLHSYIQANSTYKFTLGINKYIDQFIQFQRMVYISNSYH